LRKISIIFLLWNISHLLLYLYFLKIFYNIYLYFTIFRKKTTDQKVSLYRFSWFLRKISIFGLASDFRPNFRFLTKIFVEDFTKYTFLFWKKYKYFEEKTALKCKCKPYDFSKIMVLLKFRFLSKFRTFC